MKIYTKTGDNGTTSLIGGRRVVKTSSRIEAYGTIDELMAHTGYLLDNVEANKKPEAMLYCQTLATILNHLMDLSSHLAAEGDVVKKLPIFNQDNIDFLENMIDQISEQLPPIDKFTLPCGHPVVSLCHVCRTVCRRGEREIIRVTEQNHIDELLIGYINRLSDFFYVLARHLSIIFGAKEYYWVANK